MCFYMRLRVKRRLCVVFWQREGVIKRDTAFVELQSASGLSACPVYLCYEMTELP